MLLTKKALSAKTIEKFIDALALSCKSGVIDIMEEATGKILKPNGIRIDQRDYPPMREVIPMSDAIASIVNIGNDRRSIRAIDSIYRDGKNLTFLLDNLEGREGDLVFGSLMWYWHRLDIGIKFRTEIAKILISDIRKSGIEPNDYLPVIKMDVIQGAYIGRFT